MVTATYHKTIKAALIGCGSISSRHIASLLQLDRVRIVGVCDLCSDRAQEAALETGGRAYTDYKEMLSVENPDVVHICTPHYLHAEMTEFALSRGIHVLCEKPMTIRYEDAERLVALADEKKLLYGIIFQSRYNVPSVTVKEHLESGKLGRILSARCTLTWKKETAYYNLSDWKGTWEKEGGGVVIDQAIHSLDLCNWLIGSRPVSVQASLYNRCHPEIEVEDCAEGHIVFENGATLSFWVMNNYGCNEPIEIRLCCEKGKAILSYDEALIIYDSGERVQVESDRSIGKMYKKGKEYWGYNHFTQIKQFYASVCGEAELEVSGREALRTQDLICRIYRYGNFKRSDKPEKQLPLFP